MDCDRLDSVSQGEQLSLSDEVDRSGRKDDGQSGQLFLGKVFKLPRLSAEVLDFTKPSL